MTPAPLLHGTCIAIKDQGVLILGASGAGKSDLALRLIDRGAALVGDDYLEARVDDGQLFLSAPTALQGRLEVRQIGLLRLPWQARALIALIVRLGERPERLPEPMTETCLGIAVPVLQISPFEASAPIKVELALQHGVGIA